MRRSTFPLVPLSAVLLISLACGFLPSIPVTAPTLNTLDPSALGTVIMQTAAAAATQTAALAVPIDIVSSPAIPFTPETPTLTATATLSPTPLFTDTPVSTNTPLVPVIVVSMDTNCRTGPGQAYEQVGALLVGETAEVVGRAPNRDYWYVRNPDKEGEYCWLWGKYATLAGNVSVLPLFTPPPTPTPVPSFEALYTGLEKCSGWWVDLELTNTGGIDFRSVSVIIRDINTNADISMYADQFKAIDNCVGSTTRDVLHAGGILTVSVPAFAYEPDGHKLRATITMCSEPGQNGTCVTQVVKFSP